MISILNLDRHVVCFDSELRTAENHPDAYLYACYSIVNSDEKCDSIEKNDSSIWKKKLLMATINILVQK